MDFLKVIFEKQHELNKRILKERHNQDYDKICDSDNQVARVPADGTGRDRRHGSRRTGSPAGESRPHGAGIPGALLHELGRRPGGVQGPPAAILIISPSAGADALPRSPPHPPSGLPP